jgi:probable HAF family extracellular repeat protein
MKAPYVVHHVDRQFVGIFAIAMTGLAGWQSTALAQTFTGVGFLPGGTKSYAGSVSSDGSVVVGMGSTPSGDRVFRWTRGGVAVSLGTLPGGTYSNGGVVSHDGSVVVGTSASTVGERAFRWASGVMENLGTLPPVEGGLMSFGYGVSGDGFVVVGMGDDNDSPQLGVRWTSAGGMTRLGTLGGPYSIAGAANLDGSVVVGDSTTPGGSHAFRWTAASGMLDLGTLPGGTGSLAGAVSDDGAVAAGTSNTFMNGLYRTRATRWITDGGGTTTSLNLGVLTGMSYSRAYGVSNDGAVAVGLSGNDIEHERATLWNASMGLVDLNTYLPTLGINLTGWTLTSAYEVTGDGRTIVGNGTHNGVSEGWVATIPPPPACFR